MFYMTLFVHLFLPCTCASIHNHCAIQTEVTNYDKDNAMKNLECLCLFPWLPEVTASASY